MESKLKVKLLSHTPNPDEIVSCAAKLCYSKVGVEQIQEKCTPEEVQRFLNMLIDIKHESPLEHTSFTFAIEGISRACSHQIVRHRIASYSQQSQRYVRLDQFEYIIPTEIKNNNMAKEIYIRAMENAQEAYDELVATLILKYAQEENLISQYENSNQSSEITLEEYLIKYEKSKYLKMEKKAIEDARYVFPNGCETKIIITMNARSLFNFFKHRCCERAQSEIRELATQMLIEVKKIAPIMFKDMGPNCLTKPCPEGKMSCGKINEVREKFKNLI